MKREHVAARDKLNLYSDIDPLMMKVEMQSFLSYEMKLKVMKREKCNIFSWNARIPMKLSWEMIKREYERW